MELYGVSYSIVEWGSVEFLTRYSYVVGHLWHDVLSGRRLSVVVHNGCLVAKRCEIGLR